MTRTAWTLRVILVLFSLSGAYISMLLLNEHLFKDQGPDWFASVCGGADERPGAAETEHKPSIAEPADPSGSSDAATSSPAAPAEEHDPASAETGTDRKAPARSGWAAKLARRNCAEVLASRWATIPPRPAEEPPPPAPGAKRPKHIRVPTAFLGLVYFTALAIWFFFVGQPSYDRREFHRLVLLFMLGGVLGSLFFIGVMLTQTEAWCPWCMVSHVLNLLIFGGLLLLRPRPSPATVVTVPVSDTSAEGAVSSAPVDEEADVGPAAVSVVGESAWSVDQPARAPHPSGALVACCVLLTAATGAMVWNGYGVRLERHKTEVVQHKLKAFENDTSFLEALYAKAPKVNLPRRPDDPMIANGEILRPLVVFSDFECPHCARFALFLKNTIQPLFGGNLRVVWKHFPLSTDCNDTIKVNLHPYACQAALAAEAARAQGGNEAFWKAHDLLFKNRKRLGDLDYAALARELGLDPVRFEQDMQSEELLARIKEDIKLARSVGVRGTPAVFLSGRRVDKKLVGLTLFWKMMAYRFDQLRDAKLKQMRERGHQSAGSGKLNHGPGPRSAGPTKIQRGPARGGTSPTPGSRGPKGAP